MHLLFKDALSTDLYSVYGQMTITGEVQECERERSGMFGSRRNFTVPSENNETTQTEQTPHQKLMPRPPGIPNHSAESWDTERSNRDIFMELLACSKHLNKNTQN
jgi:hypothetical protein